MTSLPDEIRHLLAHEAREAKVAQRDPRALARRVILRRVAKQGMVALVSIAAGVVFIAGIGALVGEDGVRKAPGVADGGKATELIVNPPGRSGILFTALTASGKAQLFRAGTGGGNVRRITDGQPSRSASWSPDGSLIAFSRGSETDSRLYVMEADGSSPRHLTEGPVDVSPVWSPDATRIAFVGLLDGNDDVYVMNADGSGLKQLTHGTGSDYQPSWSPDGSKIAYTTSNPGEGDLAVHVMNPDGSGDRVLVDGPGSESSPVWSPDGGKLAFAREAPALEQRRCLGHKRGRLLGEAVDFGGG